MPQQKVSAVLITYNEADIIAKTLKSLTWCDEIIVIDSFSTDDTCSICEQYGCKVFKKKFEGFGNQKQYAVSQAKNNWVLNIDADEILTNELINEIQHEMNNPSADGYRITRKFVFLGKIFKYGKESRTSYLRLFDKTKGNFNDAQVHEIVELRGKIAKMKGSFLHYSYKNLSHYFYKFNGYTSATADVAYKKQKKKSTFLIVLSIPFTFIKYYFIDLNILNGFSGFCWSLLSTFYHFTKYIKIKELYQQNNI